MIDTWVTTDPSDIGGGCYEAFDAWWQESVLRFHEAGTYNFEPESYLCKNIIQFIEIQKKTMLMLCMRSAECTFVSKSYHCDSHGGEEGEVPNSRAEVWIGGEEANLFLLLREWKVLLRNWKNFIAANSVLSWTTAQGDSGYVGQPPYWEFDFAIIYCFTFQNGTPTQAHDALKFQGSRGEAFSRWSGWFRAFEEER